jgi:hypothetical protein
MTDQEKNDDLNIEVPSLLTTFWESTTSAAIAITSGIAGLSPELSLGIAGLGAYALTARAGFGQRDLVQKVLRRLEKLDREKLDKDAFESDEFNEILFQVLEVSSRTASDVKRRALANMLVNAVVTPTSRYKGKQTYIRLIDQMSSDEMLALAILYQTEAALPDGDSRHLAGISVTEMAEKLDWDEQDAIAIYEGLFQLTLVIDTGTGTFGHYGNQHRIWQTSVLAKRLEQFCLDEADFQQTSASD